MSKCNLRIEWSDTQDFVEPGGELDVIVHVECSHPTKCNGLTLTRHWATHGNGNRAEGSKRVEELFRGEWEPGSYSYPTTVRFPQGPTSYHGEAINLDWYLEARADVPLAFDPKTERAVLVVDATPARPFVAPAVWSPVPIKLEAGMAGCMIPSFIGGAIAAGLFYASHPIMAGFLLLLSVSLLVGSIKARATLKRVGTVALEIHPKTLAPGETLHAIVELHPNAAIEFESITMSVTATEEATSGSGSNTTTTTKQVFALKELVAKRLHLDGIDPFEYEASFTLPVTAPMSLDVSDNEISTEFKLSVQPQGKPELTYTEVLAIRPTTS